MDNTKLISTNGSVVYGDTAEEDCMRICERNRDQNGQEINCVSFTYDHKAFSCRIYTEKAKPFGTMEPTASAGMRYFEKICTQDALPRSCDNIQYIRADDSVLVGYASNISLVDTIEQCVVKCVFDSKCKSAMYFYEEGECITNSESAMTKPSSFSKDDTEKVIYFENSCYLALANIETDGKDKKVEVQKRTLPRTEDEKTTKPPIKTKDIKTTKKKITTEVQVVTTAKYTNEEEASGDEVEDVISDEKNKKKAVKTEKEARREAEAEGEDEEYVEVEEVPEQPKTTSRTTTTTTEEPTTRKPKKNMKNMEAEYEMTEVPDDDQSEWEYVDEKKEAAKMQKEKEKQKLKPERKVQKKAEIEPQPAEEHEYEETEQEQQSETNQEEKMAKKYKNHPRNYGSKTQVLPEKPESQEEYDDYEAQKKPQPKEYPEESDKESQNYRRRKPEEHKRAQLKIEKNHPIEDGENLFSEWSDWTPCNYSGERQIRRRRCLDLRRCLGALMQTRLCPAISSQPREKIEEENDSSMESVRSIVDTDGQPLSVKARKEQQQIQVPVQWQTEPAVSLRVTPPSSLSSLWTPWQEKCQEFASGQPCNNGKMIGFESRECIATDPSQCVGPFFRYCTLPC
ncbi:hypothetical protein WR25_26575 [Diploscapter pachys]|uniref:Apple domain-containing protein n=1 Tax=Diploscapter pachys TaxID=2018661 RepID=A0A2A2KCF6_9BILA|nr:hypothetical protein WR25_26575 [Diploscapter pachys]